MKSTHLVKVFTNWGVEEEWHGAPYDALPGLNYASPDGEDFLESLPESKRQMVPLTFSAFW